MIFRPVVAGTVLCCPLVVKTSTVLLSATFNVSAVGVSHFSLLARIACVLHHPLAFSKILNQFLDFLPSRQLRIVY